MPNRFGYCCINLSLGKSVTTSRTMRKDTFDARGLEYAGELAEKNCLDLEKIVKWNHEHNVSVFRISSVLFPWQSEYEFDQLPNIVEIREILSRIGKFCNSVNQRLSFHPSHFCCLGSNNDRVCASSAKELIAHANIMDMLEQPRNHMAKINIHVGGAGCDKKWCENFEKLPDNCRSRITVENDDRESLYNTSMLHELVYKRVGCPIVFDSLHYSCGPKDIEYNAAFELALSTWPEGERPMCHHSNSRRMQDIAERKSAHSDYYFTPFCSVGKNVDVALECKMKDLGLLDYIRKFGE